MDVQDGIVSDYPQRCVDLLKKYSKSIIAESAVFFLGAGASMTQPLELPGWNGLVSKLLTDLGLSKNIGNINYTSLEYPELVQYWCQRFISRDGEHELYDYIRPKLDIVVPKPTSLHESMVRMHLTDIWTTNYDTVVEQAYSSIGSNLDVKYLDKDVLKWKGRPRLYKMHGSIDKEYDNILHKLIMTRTTFQEYGSTHPAFRFLLQSEWITKQFLFIGFSFTDDNFRQILSMTKQFFNKEAKDFGHLAIMATEPYERRLDAGLSDEAKQELYLKVRREELEKAYMSKDLAQNYGINVIHVAGYGEVPKVVSALERLVRMRHIMVSGACFLKDHSLYDEKEDGKIIEIAEHLGSSLARNQRILVSGLGLGIGHLIVSTFASALQDMAPRSTLQSMLVPVPFPYAADASKRQELYDGNRQYMAKRAGACVFLGGVKLTADGSGRTESPGCWQEYQVAEKLGCLPIPIAASGGTARQIWLHMNAKRTDSASTNKIPDDLWQSLAKEELTAKELVEVVTKIIVHLEERPARDIKFAGDGSNLIQVVT